MTRPVKLLVSAAGLAMLLAAPVDAAQSGKNRKGVEARPAAAVPPRERGTNLFPPGPVMYGHVYLGNDPDPFIRSQILRDLEARFGGNE